MTWQTRPLLLALCVATACSDDGVPQGGSEGASDTDAGGTVATTIDATTMPPGSSGGLDGSGSSAEGDTAADTTTDPSGTMAEGSAGCGTPYTGDPVVSGAIDAGGQQRTFILSVPPGYDPAVPLPLVFAWHGRGGNAELARLYFGVEEQAAGAAIFVYPDGLPLANMGGQTGWDLADGGADVQLFDALYTQMTDNLCVDLDRVFSTGHSFGGYMSNALGCFRADVLRAIAPVAGGPPFGACQPERVAAWMTHGTADAVVPFDQGEAARDNVLGRNGCGTDTVATDPEPCVAYQGCDADHPLVWCPHDLTDQAGHLWPPFAPAAIWGFFSALAPSASP